MKRPSPLLLALGLSMYFAGANAPVFAQFPLPLFGNDEKEKKPKKKSEEAEKDETPAIDPNKVYTKPEPPVLPEGEARKLSGHILLLGFDGMVNPGMGEYVIAGIDRAAKDGAQLVLIEMNTPGGLVSTTQKMVQSIMASKVPVVVFVTPSGSHAASAGTFITLAAHVAAMSPATRIGAAHPVTGGGKDPEEEGGVHMGRKVENDLVAMVEGIAKERGRNIEWAIDAVRLSVSIDAEKAQEIGVVELIAQDRKALLEKLEGYELVISGEKVALAPAGVEVVKHELSLREKVLNLLASPGIAMILGMLGVLGILAEVYHPGLIIPGVIGVLCLLLSLISMEQLPIDLGGVLLILAGIALMVGEMYTSTYGALGALGVVGLAFGAVLLIDLENPDFSVDPSFALSWIDVMPLVLVFAGFIGLLGWMLTKNRKRTPTTGTEGLVGSTGIVLKPVSRDGGMVFVGGEYWKARAEEPLAENEDIEVVAMDGLVLVVKLREKSGGAAA